MDVSSETLWEVLTAAPLGWGKVHLSMNLLDIESLVNRPHSVFSVLFTLKETGGEERARMSFVRTHPHQFLPVYPLGSDQTAEIKVHTQFLL